MIRRKRRTLVALCALLLLMMSNAMGQKVTVSGYLYDAANGEALIGANVYDQESLEGTTTNTYGFYSLSIPSGTKTLVFSYVGYQEIILPLNLVNDTTIVLELKSGQEIEEVVVTADARAEVEDARISTYKLPMENISRMPVLLGEVDVLKSIQQLPGVQSGNEGSSGIYVRGGSPGQNLILLDGVPVYNVNHLFGFFSVFNADAINDVTLVKGGFPARYGGRLSSVVDIRMKEGNTKKFQMAGSIGLLSAKLMVTGPIIKDKTAFIISGRRSYIDLFTRAYSSSKDDGTMGYYFGDLNVKVNHKWSHKDRLFVSAYMGQDKFSGEGDWKDEESTETFAATMNWGNITSALRWNHLFSEKLFSNLTATYSRFRFENDLSYETTDYSDGLKMGQSQDYSSGVEDFAIKMDLDYYPVPAHQLKYGMQYIYHTYSPGVSSYETTSNTFYNDKGKVGDADIHAHEFALFLEDDWEVSSWLKTNLGVRFSGYQVNGEMYKSLEPRFTARAKLSDDVALKSSVAYMRQYIHLLTNSSVSLPTDLWLPATDKLKPQSSWQYAVGVNWLAPRDWKLSLEGYYKDMDQVIAYKEGAQFVPSDENWQDKVTPGRGWSYGSEFMAEKDWGKTRLSVAYTLAWSYRKFDEINQGRKYPFKYDRRHDVNVSFTHAFSDKFDVGLNWIYASGSVFTIPYEKYQPAKVPGLYYYADEDVAKYFESRNNYRAPAYHRLDVGVNFHKQRPWGQRTWSISVYNAYGRQNPAFMLVDQKDAGGMVLKQFSLFRFVPSITYSFKFK